MLKEFFAVTMTSVYRVRDDGEGRGSAEKIALKSTSAFPVGHVLTGGHMIAVCKWLMPYRPDDGDERRVENIEPSYWGENTSYIVALFLSRKLAMECFETRGELKACDSRWLGETMDVIESIGTEHPVFEFCRNPHLTMLKVTH